MTNDFSFTPSKKSKKKIFLLTLILLILVLGAGYLYVHNKINRPISSESAPVTFSVAKGASTSDVGDALVEDNLISSSFMFSVYSRLNGSSGKIQAGDYMLDKKMSMKEILETLTGGKVTRNEKRVVIVEGATNKQVSQQLQNAGLVTPNTFDAAVDQNYDFKFVTPGRAFKYEGLLFPDTYSFDANWDAEEIIFRMLKNFESKITDQMLTDMEKKNLDMSDVIILASIIEREVGRSSSVTITDAVKETLQDEREKVASVFYNRLEIDMPLQSDATVNYATGRSDRRARFSDLEIDSKYNTYKYAGLPPGPISNPGIESIRAAIYPDDTDYLYFLSSPEGVAYFGRTLEEHNRNRVNYLE